MTRTKKPRRKAEVSSYIHDKRLQDGYHLLKRSPSRDAVEGLGPRLRKLRILRGWTQAQLAEGSGVARDIIIGIEREQGRSGISFKTAIRLAQTLYTSLDYLAGRTNDPTPRF